MNSWVVDAPSTTRSQTWYHAYSLYDATRTNFITTCIDVFRGCLVAFFILRVGLRPCVVGSPELNVGFGKILCDATFYQHGVLLWYTCKLTSQSHLLMLGYLRRYRGTPGPAEVRGSARALSRCQMMLPLLQTLNT